MPWLMVNQMWPAGESDGPTPRLALDVQRAGMPGAPGVTIGVTAISVGLLCAWLTHPPTPFQLAHRKLIVRLCGLQLTGRCASCICLTIDKKQERRLDFPPKIR